MIVLGFKSNPRPQAEAVPLLAWCFSAECVGGQFLELIRSRDTKCLRSCRRGSVWDTTSAPMNTHLSPNSEYLWFSDSKIKLKWIHCGDTQISSMATVTRIKECYLQHTFFLKKRRKQKWQEEAKCVFYKTFFITKSSVLGILLACFHAETYLQIIFSLFFSHEIYPRLYDKKLYGANNLFKTRSMSHIHSVLWNQVDAEGDFFFSELSDHLYCGRESNSRYWGCQLCGDVQTHWRKIYMIF